MAFAGLLLGFALNTIAHAAHAHDPASVFSTHVPCDHCLQFGHLADAPRNESEAPITLGTFQIILPASTVFGSQAVSLAARPRGPPSFERT